MSDPGPLGPLVLTKQTKTFKIETAHLIRIYIKAQRKLFFCEQVDHSEATGYDFPRGILPSDINVATPNDLKRTPNGECIAGYRSGNPHLEYTGSDFLTFISSVLYIHRELGVFLRTASLFAKCRNLE